VRRLSLLSVSFLLGLLFVLGCSGKDGAPGATGSSGPPGVPQPINVLIMAVDGPSQVLSAAVQAYRDGHLPLGTEINQLALGDSVPPLSVLRQYDAVFVWTNTSPAYPDSLGDVLAGFVDAGGGVVVAEHAFTTPWVLGGRFMTAGYCPLGTAAPSGVAGDRTLDASSVAMPIHPIFNGVDTSNFVFRWNGNHSDPPVDPTATVLATEMTGMTAVAVNAKGTIIAVNTYGGSLGQTVYPEMNHLIANALLFVAGAF
jgi:hypothetical protein